MSEAEETPPAQPPSSAWMTALWTPLAFLSSLCGIGGGLFAMPMLHYIGRRDVRRAVGLSTVLVFVLSVTGTIVEASQDHPAFIWPAIAALAFGGWVGARVGFHVSTRINGLAVKRVFVFVLFFSAYRVFLVSSPATIAASADAHHLDPLHIAIVLAIGFGGGFISPLLGVGGGLFVVPALFLSFPSMSILEARACSVAMTIFTSGQSAYLHGRAGAVERAPLVWLAPATIVGATLGVVFVHRPGWAEYARIALGVVLVLVAARFAWDLRPKRPTQAS